MPGPPVENISDTARWVAIYRAMESERPDAHFRDADARMLGGARGERIVREMPAGRSAAWGFVVRTCLIDELIRRAVDEFRAELVVNLAAGLDTRPYRMSLPPSLSWIEVDLPGILEYKRERLANAHPVCRLETVALDLADAGARRELFSRLGARARRILTLTEGLLVYLTEEQASALAQDLHAVSAFHWWVYDVVSPALLKWMHRRYQRSLSAAGAPLRFAPVEGPDFFRRFGWSLVEFRSSFGEGRRLRREMRGAGLYRFLMKFSPSLRETMFRMAGVALLERA